MRQNNNEPYSISITEDNKNEIQEISFNTINARYIKIILIIFKPLRVHSSFFLYEGVILVLIIRVSLSCS